LNFHPHFIADAMSLAVDKTTLRPTSSGLDFASLYPSLIMNHIVGRDSPEPARRRLPTAGWVVEKSSAPPRDPTSLKLSPNRAKAGAKRRGRKNI
jgi:hypothetical protein